MPRAEHQAAVADCTAMEAVLREQGRVRSGLCPSPPPPLSPAPLPWQGAAAGPLLGLDLTLYCLKSLGQLSFCAQSTQAAALYHSSRTWTKTVLSSAISCSSVHISVPQQSESMRQNVRQSNYFRRTKVKLSAKFPCAPSLFF